MSTIYARCGQREREERERERKRGLEGGGGEKEAGYWMSLIIKTGRKNIAYVYASLISGFMNYTPVDSTNISSLS